MPSFWTPALPAGATYALLGTPGDHPDLTLPSGGATAAEAGASPDALVCAEPRPAREALAAAAREVRAGGAVLLTGALVRLAGDRTDIPTLDELMALLATCGFTEVTTHGPAPVSALSAATLAAAGIDAAAAGATVAVVGITAKTPAFGIGAAQPLRKKKPAVKVGARKGGGLVYVCFVFV
eukprot:TRINITY_DN1822_c0_g2_i3.p2 TRINITY_DN1822_c0_g2~~TRINITY_DN1822_c0_g2_i3.p2  ORF type:complete len:181 (+),score=69.44 TRINITY_DN1822_c0_g2_i3:129-671(+)